MIFFFQAEDGIRDTSVTGVQTCALPIWRSGRSRPSRDRGRRSRSPRAGRRSGAGSPAAARPSRSEERRVGKECRYRRKPYLVKEKVTGYGVGSEEDDNGVVSSEASIDAD